MTCKTVKTACFEMPYLQFGSGERPFVILPGMSVRSVMRSAPAVAGAYRSFASTHTVYLFDRKNGIEDGYTVKDMADDTAKAMQSLGIADADVFGASQGGMIAEVLAIDYPELIHKAVLGSTLARGNRMSNETFSTWMELCKAGDIRALNHDVFTRVYSKNYYQTYQKAFETLESDGTPEEMRRFHALAAASKSFDVYEELPKITCPILAIGAEEDNVLSVKGTQEITEKLDCRSYVYADYGHAVYDEAPDYRTRIAHFFQSET